MNMPSLKETKVFATLFFVLLAPGLHAQQYQDTSAPVKLIDAFHAAFGDHHSRAVHAKGIFLEGDFTPSGEAAKITSAAPFQQKASKVFLRYSDFTGIPDIPDNTGLANPRGIAIKLVMPDGSTTDLIGHSFNGFPVATTDEFRNFLLSIGASGAGASKPTPLDTFIATHPITKTFLTTQKIPASFASITYFGVNAFRFTNRQGISNFIRYQFVPEAGERLLTPEQLATQDPQYLINEIKSRISQQPIKLKVYAQVAVPGDKIEDPSVAWPNERSKVLLGTVVLRKLSANTVSEDKSMTFNPGNIPVGITMADPMVDFRSRTYNISVDHRQ